MPTNTTLQTLIEKAKKAHEGHAYVDMVLLDSQIKAAFIAGAKAFGQAFCGDVTEEYIPKERIDIGICYDAFITSLTSPDNEKE